MQEVHTNKTSLKIQAAKNVGASWLGLLVNVAVGFFLAPFILHKLGDEAFGLWILVVSLTGYYGLFDFGIRSSIVRYVARFAATGDWNQLARFVSTSLFVYSGIALLLLAVTGMGWFYLDALFQISPAFLGTARLLLLIVGVGVALGFPFSVFAGVLQGMQKFTWINLIQIGQVLVRALLVIIALQYGGGLLAIGLITVALNLLSYISHTFLAFRTIRLPLGLRFVDPATFRRMIIYSSVTFVIMIAERLRFHSDAVVIGIFLSSQAITYFAIAGKLVEYTTWVVQVMAQIFTPMSSQFDAGGDIRQLQKVFLQGNRACALTIVPMCAILIVLGKSIIEVWVGAQYASSYLILLLLIVPKTLYLAQAASTKILFGMGRHGMLALVLAVEGVANLCLSIFLLRRLGIVGVALGTAIPLACTSLFFLPRHLCRLLKIPLRTYLRQTYTLPLVLSAPLVIALLLLRRYFHATNYVELFLQVALAGGVYAIGLLWFIFYKEPGGVALRARFTDFLQQSLSQ